MMPPQIKPDSLARLVRTIAMSDEEDRDWLLEKLLKAAWPAPNGQHQ